MVKYVGINWVNLTSARIIVHDGRETGICVHRNIHSEQARLEMYVSIIFFNKNAFTSSDIIKCNKIVL